MNVSRQTFGRIIDSAHKKVAEAVVHGKALKIEGGEFEIAAMRRFNCYECQHSWELPYGTGRPESCPSCKSGNIHRVREEKGQARGYGRGHGGCCRGTQQKQ
jgi:Zn finger protein HypA/HybF involved in hydrogenase expression